MADVDSAVLRPREKFWLLVVAAVVATWVVGAMVWAEWRRPPSAPGPTDTDFQTAALSLAEFDGSRTLPLLDYENQLRQLAPKCRENVATIANLFIAADDLQRVELHRTDIVVYKMLIGFNSWMSKRVEASSCAQDLGVAEGVLALGAEVGTF